MVHKLPPPTKKITFYFCIFSGFVCQKIAFGRPYRTWHKLLGVKRTTTHMGTGVTHAVCRRAAATSSLEIDETSFSLTSPPSPLPSTIISFPWCRCLFSHHKFLKCAAEEEGRKEGRKDSEADAEGDLGGEVVSVGSKSGTGIR